MRGWMWSAVLSLFLLPAACAHVESPSGGPPIRGPLELSSTRPDSLQIVEPFRGPVIFTFERRLSEQGLREAVSVSPETSPVSVSHSGRELRVSLRGGWEAGRIYHVTVLPAFQDLWANRPIGATELVFSTGPEVPDTRLAGSAIDRITGRPEIGIRVEAIRGADSLVYATRTDSSGVFTLNRIPDGEYQLRAFRDLNRNQALDDFEPRDSSRVTIAEGDSAGARLRVVPPDSLPPEPQRAEIARGVIEIVFDDFLDPTQDLQPEQVEIVDAAGIAVPVARLAVGSLPDDVIPAEPEDPEAEEGIADPTAAVSVLPPEVPADTLQEPLPSQRLAVEPGAPLVPDGLYTIRVQAIVNVVGLAGDGEVTVTVPPEEPEPPDPPANGNDGNEADVAEDEDAREDAVLRSRAPPAAVTLERGLAVLRARVPPSGFGRVAHRLSRPPNSSDQEIER